MTKEYQEWLLIAEGDVEKAQILFDAKKFDGAAFYCQQAVEKALKSIIIKNKKEIPKIHDLVQLGELTGLPPKFKDSIKKLTQVYIYTRYPDIGHIEHLQEKAAEFLKKTKEILIWIKSL